LKERNRQWREKLKPINSKISRITSLAPDNTSDIRKYIKGWLPIVQNSGLIIKSDMLSIHGQSALDGALRESWGMPEVEAKKILAIAMAILVEFLIFAFAILPRLLSRKKLKRRKPDSQGVNLPAKDISHGKVYRYGDWEI